MKKFFILTFIISYVFNYTVFANEIVRGSDGKLYSSDAVPSGITTTKIENSPETQAIMDARDKKNADEQAASDARIKEQQEKDAAADAADKKAQEEAGLIPNETNKSEGSTNNNTEDKLVNPDTTTNKVGPTVEDGVIKDAEVKAINDGYIQDATETVKSNEQAAYDKFLNEPSDANSEAYKEAQAEIAKLETPEGKLAAIEEGKTATAKAKAAEAFKNSPDNIGSANFTLDVNKLSPSTFGWNKGPEENIKQLLHNITYLLLIIIPSLAVLFIIVGGIKIILAGGDSSKVGQGKTIINFNIIAVVISLLSYSIVQLTAWILGG